MDDILSHALACCYQRIKPRTDSIRRGRVANLLELLWHHRERRKLGTGLKYPGQPRTCVAFFLRGFDYEFRNLSFTCWLCLDAILLKAAVMFPPRQVFTWLHGGKLHSSCVKKKWMPLLVCNVLCWSRLLNENASPYYQMCTAGFKTFCWMVEWGEREGRRAREEDMSTCIAIENMASPSGPV